MPIWVYQYNKSSINSLNQFNLFNCTLHTCDRLFDFKCLQSLTKERIPEFRKEILWSRSEANSKKHLGEKIQNESRPVKFLDILMNYMMLHSNFSKWQQSINTFIVILLASKVNMRFQSRAVVITFSQTVVEDAGITWIHQINFENVFLSRFIFWVILNCSSDSKI